MNTSRPPRGKVVVLGFLFWYPLAGVVYQFLHYLRGLRDLGYDVYYVEDAVDYVYDPVAHDRQLDASDNIARVAPILEQHGFAGRWAFRTRFGWGENKSYGMSDEAVSRLFADADALLNVTGWHVLSDEHMTCRRRIYVESDPFSVQVEVAQGNEEVIARLDAHDTFFSFGENIGAPDCIVPPGRYLWQPTRQPVSLDLWEPLAPSAAPYTTITTWQNSNKHRQFEGVDYYWTKDREFRKFLDLPQRRRVPFRMATRVDEETRALLLANGWEHEDGVETSSSVERYRDFIRTSRGEFTVARDQYVRPRTGWFSDRSATYLAAGRPVITQETAFSKFLPTGRGLFSFSTMDEVLAAVDSIESDHRSHCDAARGIAAAYFSTDVVLGSLMERAGL
jgi:hypothetical protein